MSNREEFEKAYTNAFIGEELKGLESIIFARFEIGGEYAQDKVATAYAMWQARVPEGYMVVPVELADEIEDKIWDNLSANHTITNQEGDGFIPVEDIDLGDIYKAMIEAVEK